VAHHAGCVSHGEYKCQIAVIYLSDTNFRRGSSAPQAAPYELTHLIALRFRPAYRVDRASRPKASRHQGIKARRLLISLCDCAFDGNEKNAINSKPENTVTCFIDIKSPLFFWKISQKISACGKLYGQWIPIFPALRYLNLQVATCRTSRAIARSSIIATVMKRLAGARPTLSPDLPRSYFPDETA